MPDSKLQLDSWRIFRILAEFVDGFETMVSVGPSVSIFGSARIPPDHEYYAVAEKVSRKIAEKGFGIITGGGPGAMAAANKGAQEAKSPSCGISINLPYEESHNPYIDKEYLLKLRYYFVRKVLFIRYAIACVFLPGGFGTLDELFETLTLIQTKKIKRFPIFLIGTTYWEKMIDWLKQSVMEGGYIDKSDLELFTVTDDLDMVADIIQKYGEQAPTTTFEIGKNDSQLS
ncbi:MAG: TIGR00730 family Rossman fold protein [Chlamydiales bacterium]